MNDWKEIQSLFTWNHSWTWFRFMLSATCGKSCCCSNCMCTISASHQPWAVTWSVERVFKLGKSWGILEVKTLHKHCWPLAQVCPLQPRPWLPHGARPSGPHLLRDPSVPPGDPHPSPRCLPNPRHHQRGDTGARKDRGRGQGANPPAHRGPHPRPWRFYCDANACLWTRWQHNHPNTSSYYRSVGWVCLVFGKLFLSARFVGLFLNKQESLLWLYMLIFCFLFSCNGLCSHCRNSTKKNTLLCHSCERTVLLIIQWKFVCCSLFIS